MNVYRRFTKEGGRKVPLSPFYYADLMDNGKRLRVSTKCSDKKEAQTKALEMQNALNEKAKGVLNGKQAISLAEAVDLYLHDLKVRRKGLRNWLIMRDKLFGLTPAFKDRFRMDPSMALHELATVHLERLKAARVAEGNKEQTIAHELKLLRAASRYVQELGTYRIPDIVKWRLPMATQKTRYLSWEEFDALYRYLDPDRPVDNKRAVYTRTGKQHSQVQDVQDLLVALVLTGGRWSEVAALTWDRVDLENETIRLFGTKTDKERVVAMPRQVTDVLRRRRVIRDLHSPLIFPARNGGVRRGSCQAILRAMNKVGLNRPDIVERYGKATVHSLRHTYASWLIQHGADLAEAQEALGHASLQMTRRYAHLSGKSVRKLGSILSEVASGLN